MTAIRGVGNIVCNCQLCKKYWIGIHSGNGINMTATSLCVLILQSLMELDPSKSFYSMKEDIYGFVVRHWQCVRPYFDLFSKKKWKKMLLDTFHHCNRIESGGGYGLKASFRLKVSARDSVVTDEICSRTSETTEGIAKFVMAEEHGKGMVINNNYNSDHLRNLQGCLYNTEGLFNKYYSMYPSAVNPNGVKYYVGETYILRVQNGWA